MLSVVLVFLLLIPSSTIVGSSPHLMIQTDSQNLILQAPPTGLVLRDMVTPPTTIVRFNGTMYGDANPWYPPDVQVAAGPTYVVETVNTMVTVYTKQGVLAKASSLQVFFGVGGHFFDSRILYDTSSQRWFVSSEDFLTGILYLAVSKTSDPTGDWWIFPFNSTPSCIPDQPTLGVSDDKIVVSVNGCLGVQYWIFNKNLLLTGQSVYDSSVLGFSVFSVHPAQALSPTTTLYMITSYDGQPGSVRLYSLIGVPPGPVMVDSTDLTVAPLVYPPRAPQLGSPFLLDTGDNRVLDAKWDLGMLWVSLNDGCTPTGDTQTRSCVRLLQIDTLAGQVTQDFDVGSAGQYYFYPAVSPDAHGNIIVVFAQASPTSYPGLMAATQLIKHPGTLGRPTIIAAGSEPDVTFCTVNRGCRYGDYFEAARDPSNPGIVWVAGQYGTRALTFPPSLTWATMLAALSVHRPKL